MPLVLLLAPSQRQHNRQCVDSPIPCEKDLLIYCKEDISVVVVVVVVAQSCPTLCNPMDCSPPGSSVHGILLARILEWVATPFSRGSSQPRDQAQVSYIAGKVFTICATREVSYLSHVHKLYTTQHCINISLYIIFIKLLTCSHNFKTFL